MSTVSIQTNGLVNINVSYDRKQLRSSSSLASPWSSPTEIDFELAKYVFLTGDASPTAEEAVGRHITGLTDSYVTSNFSSGTWTSNSGSYNSNLTRGTPAISADKLNGFDILEGGTADGLQFPSNLMTSAYTIFHVARYDGTEERIFSSYSNNWLSGFWDGNAGVAYHEDWITPRTDYEGTNWVISTDQKDLYRSNGTTRSDGTTGTTLIPSLSINYGIQNQYSDFQVAEIIVFNRELNSTEYGQVEQYLSKKYNLPIAGTVATTWPFLGYYALSDISIVEPTYAKPSISFKTRLPLKSTATKTSNLVVGGGGSSGPSQSWF
jgi:hypothetical protein